MKTRLFRTSLLLTVLAPLTLQAADPIASAAGSGRPVIESVGLMVLYALVGVVIAIVGYRLFDKFTPGDLNKEIVENKNVGAAIVAGAVILGVSLIVAAAIVG